MPEKKLFNHKKSMRPVIFCLLALLSMENAFPQNIIYNGNFSDNLNYWYLGGVGQYCDYHFIPLENSNILQIDVFEKPPNFWQVQLLQDYQTGIGFEDVLLLEFNLKNPSGQVAVAVQDNGYPWKKYIWIYLHPSPIEENYRIAFDGSLFEWNTGDVELCFFMGYETGIIELSEISYQNLGANVNIDSLNVDFIYHKFFGNQVVSDEWREPAQNRIDSLRTSPLTIVCKNADGRLLENVKIYISQLKKDFPFGVAVAANLFGGQNYNETYVEKAGQLFNMITIENHLKWKMYQWAHPSVDYVFNWADEKNIPIHGHCLFWPSYNFCPDWLQVLSPQTTYDSVIAHVEQYCDEFSGKVVHWDVLNEAVNNNEIWEYTGIQLLADCYIVAKESDSTVLLMYNDFSILSTDSAKQNQVIDLVTQLVEMGAPIEGIGVQGHLHFTNLPTPATAIKNLDKMTQLGLPIFITELDIFVGEYWDFQAEYFRDILTALYSHPAVKGIIQWGFWEGSHWRPDAALYNLDWTARPVGLVFEDLMFDTWNTDSIIFTVQNGVAGLKCFNGELSVFGDYNGKFAFDTVFLEPFSNDTLELIFDYVNFYVDGENGNNNNPGTEELPWKTIQKAFDSSIPGSNVFIKEGIYNEEILANVSGNGTDGFITFTNYENDEVIIDGTGLPEKILLDISGQDYLRIKGLEFRNSIGNYSIGILIADGASFIRLINNKIHDVHFSANPNAPVNPDKNSQPLIVYGDNAGQPCSNIFIQGNEIYNCRTGYSEGMALNGNVENFLVTQNCVHDIRNIGIDIIGHEETCPNPEFDQARNGIVSWNFVYNCWSEYATAAGIYVDGAKNIIIENNTVHHNQWGIEVGCENTGKSASDIIVRDNLIFKNEVSALALGGYDYPSGSGKVVNCKLTNNTCFWNDTSLTWTGELYLTYSEDCRIFNNIFYTNQNNFLLELDATPVNLELDYNLWFCPDGSENAEVYWNGQDLYGFTNYVNTTGQDQNSIFGDPLFVDIFSVPPDFYLSGNSPAIDAGDPDFETGEGEQDMNGNARIFNNIVDIGAYEFFGALATQSLDIPAGWSGISSYVLPFDTNIENLMNQVSENLIILQNFDGAYWPGGNINTLVNWNYFSGYSVKMENVSQIVFSGTTPEEKSVNLTEGWNIIPVLSDVPLSIDSLFSDIIIETVIVKEVAGWRVYWPEMNIFSLQELEPGKAYFVLMNSDCILHFE